MGSHPLLDRAGEQVAEREIRCFTGWSRRNVYPPHPNIHTDLDVAQRHGFPTMIMSASQIVPHLHEALIDAVGADRFFSSVEVEYRMIRPVPAEGIAYARVLRTEDPSVLTIQVDDGGDSVFITGRATLPGS
jgi:hypothetical protein